MRRSHGHCEGGKSPTYLSWQEMKRRCLNPKVVRFSHYGGRGILVCNKWLQFEGFLADMGIRPKGKTIERLNNNGNYEPGNCAWGTIAEQSKNRSSTVLVTFKGKTLCLSDWAKKLRIKPNTLWYRARKYGWTGDRLFGRVRKRRS